MIEELFESGSFRWTDLRAASSVEHIPQALSDLLSAPDAASADGAYWKLDNTVVVQGALYEVAEPLCRFLSYAIHRATPAGRIRGLELLEQILCGYPSPVEIAAGNTLVQQRCCVVSTIAFGTVLSALYSKSEEEVGIAATILEHMGSALEVSLQESAVWHLENAARNELHSLTSGRLREVARMLPMSNRDRLCSGGTVKT